MADCIMVNTLVNLAECRRWILSADRKDIPRTSRHPATILDAIAIVFEFQFKLQN